VAATDSGAERVFLEALEGVLQELDLSLNQAARTKILSHYRLLVQWNRRMSLTTVRDSREIAVRHFGESLFLARELGNAPKTILDVGSGAGFPGLPVAVAFAGAQVTLLESVQRKAVFLREVSRSWGNVEVRNERLEGLSGHWELAVMRAVAAGATLEHLARISERVALLTGEEGAEEARRTPFFAWDTPISLPWGKRRVLLKGFRAGSS
jgi:16S rRNA (guanine527-N7)-methyltransferase